MSRHVVIERHRLPRISWLPVGRIRGVLPLVIEDSLLWDVPVAAIPSAVADIRIDHHIPVRGCRMAVERGVRLAPAFPAVAWRTDVVVQLAVERSVVEPV